VQPGGVSSCACRQQLLQRCYSQTPCNALRQLAPQWLRVMLQASLVPCFMLRELGVVLLPYPQHISFLRGAREDAGASQDQAKHRIAETGTHCVE
jgi:hypothetical protein